MLFELSEEQKAFQSRVREIYRRDVSPLVEEYERREVSLPSQKRIGNEGEGMGQVQRCDQEMKLRYLGQAQGWLRVGLTGQTLPR